MANTEVRRGKKKKVGGDTLFIYPADITGSQIEFGEGIVETFSTLVTKPRLKKKERRWRDSLATVTRSGIRSPALGSNEQKVSKPLYETIDASTVLPYLLLPIYHI